ncbi:hypothetical protein WA026_018807 [Henosepilachna vigintioctopunctata]|uniref:GrpE-like protein n=1 Tax=Henosepilachna vigintioctopunctata TaxID=420089 RepID=A0AAW1TW66_9CUCU
MALQIRNLLKCGNLINESMKFFPRSIVMSSLRKNTTADEGKTQETKPPPVGGDKSSDFDIDNLNKKIVELSEKNDELLDKYKRALADGENLRQRLVKQISDAKIFGVQSLCKDLLDVADVLSKATESVPKEELNEKNPHLKSLYEGLVVTEAQLKNVFKRYGLEHVNPLNEKFDPNYHEALFQQSFEDDQQINNNNNILY